MHWIPALSKENARRMGWLAFGLTACLMAPACRTSREAGGAVGECPVSPAATSNTLRKLNEIVIPEMTFFAPATIIDAVDFLKQASREYDTSGAPPEERGVSFTVSLPQVPLAGGDQQAADPFAVGAVTNGIVPKIPAISVRDISLHDAIQLVCDVTDMRWHIRGHGGVMLVPKGWDLDEDRATRSYNIPLALHERRFVRPLANGADADPNKAWRTFFAELGVTGAEFDRFEYLPAVNKLRVTSTPQNLAAIEVVLDQFALRMIEIEMQMHAFRAKDIERLRLAGGVSVETLTTLQKEGRSKRVATATALTKSGQEAVVKAVREVLYPTELLTDGGQTGSNVTSRVAANALVPGNFEMRETGMILQVVPEITHGGTVINLMLNPTWVTLKGWKSYPADLAAGWTHKTLPLRQPVFGVTSFQTQVAVEDGGTLLLGSCSTPDGEWVQVGFLTARLRNVQTRSPGGKLDTATREVTQTLNAERRTPNAEGVCTAKPKDEDRCASVAQKMRDIVIPEMTFRPPATLIDAVRFFKEAGIKYDRPGIPKAQRGLSFVVKLPTNEGAPVIPAVNARFIDLYDALKLVCDVTGMKFRIKDGIVWIMPMVEPEGGLITRVYPVLTCMQERMSHADSSRKGDVNRPGWRDFFAQMGVNWPEGSSVSYEASEGLLRVTNTPENLDVFELVLEDLNVCPRMVEVEVQIHAFRPADIERLRLSDGVSVAALAALRQQGKAKPVASATVLTKSGQEAVMKCVLEMLYPAELWIDGGPGALTPSGFEIREVGMLLQVVPELGASDPTPTLISVTLNPQWVTLDRWETYPADLAAGWAHKTLPFRQPVLGVTSFQTQLTVEDGGTVLLGSSSTPDGKWVNVGFLTAKRVNVQSGLSKRQP